jgi:ethanolamine utilization protein EutJ
VGRDGVVVDFAGASAIVRELKAELEERLGRELRTAATTYPPGVPVTEVRATRYILESVGLECTALVDEPTAANAVLQVRDGAVVDVGGGTTGIAVLRDGEVVYTADEPTGGTHLTLVIAGAHRVPFEQAEQMKTDHARHGELYPIVRPVLERVATIVTDHLDGHEVERIYLVGGTSAFPGIAGVVEELTGVSTTVPGNPLFVTPLGVALHDDPDPVTPTPGALP